MKIKLFWKEECPRCPAAKAAVTDFDNVEYYNIEEVDGLAEASFYGVLSTPSLIIVDEADKEVAAWLGEAPRPEEIRKCLSRLKV